MEALAACFAICGQWEWAEIILAPFAYGEAFLDINREILERYAACQGADEVKEAEAKWMVKLEQEYADSRAEGSREEEEEEGVVHEIQNGDLPPSDGEDDGYQQYLRQKVLNSKAFANLEPVKKEKAASEEVAGEHEDSGPDYGNDDRDSADGIVDATQVHEGAGPSIMQPFTRDPSGETISFIIPRREIPAPKRGVGS